MKFRRSIGFRAVLSLGSFILLSSGAMAAAAGTTINGTKPGKLKDLPMDMQASVSAALGREDTAYYFRTLPGGLLASRVRESKVNLNDRGLQIQVGDSALALTLEAFGRSDELRPVPPATMAAKANRVEYARGRITEWYVNGPIGLEQGFTVSEPPGYPLSNGTRNGGIAFSLRLTTDLTVSVDPGRTGITLRHPATGQAVLNYRGLTAIDADGKELLAWLELDPTANSTLLLHVDDRGARYPLTVDPWIMPAKLTASDGADDDLFGSSVSVSGDTIVVGAPHGDGTGEAYVFTKPIGGWVNMTQTAKLTPSDNPTMSYFGCAVAISGDTIVVGARGVSVYKGKAYVYAKPGGGWTNMTENAQLTASNGASYDNFGISVAISGSTVVVGAVYGGNPDTGLAYVFLRGSSWSGNRTENAILAASNGVDESFGQSVAIDGNTVVVGAPYADPGGDMSYAGAAYVFLEPSPTWSGSRTEDCKLIGSDATFQGQLGYSVAVSGGTIVAGSWANLAVHVFVDSTMLWSGTRTETARLTRSDGYAFNVTQVAIDGGTIVAVSNGDGAFVYVNPGVWSGTRTEDAQLLKSDGNSDLGSAAAISGDTIVVGADADNNLQGAAFVTQKNFKIVRKSDFDGDRKSDISVWRPGDGTWYILPSDSPAGTFWATQWGITTDIPVSSDYNADGKTDVAVWRPEDGTWYILPSGDAPGTFLSVQWGIASDKPVPGDYNGDGESDVAVWRPDVGMWYIVPSGGGGLFAMTQWGIASDAPVPQDYDGDGITDVSVWRPGDGTWYVLPSSKPGTYTATQWGVSSDKPVPADYDGDGKADIAVWRPSDGAWYIMPSSDPENYTTTFWGMTGDLPTAGDYDGDGMADIAVWRPNVGTWYVLPSGGSGTYTETQWGIASDAPISALVGIYGAAP